MGRHRVQSANTVIPSKFESYETINSNTQTSDDLEKVQSFIGDKLKANNIQKVEYQRPVNGFSGEGSNVHAGGSPQNIKAELHDHVFNQGMPYSHLVSNSLWS